jgi:type III secretion protein J
MRRALIMIAAVLTLTGCGKVNLYSQLSEQQANEIVALLLDAHIDADKVSQDKSWVVRTSKSELPRAVDLLRRYGYPHEQFESIGEVFKKDSFVSSPLEERARFLHAMSQELSHTISSIDGVIVARVHVAMPEHDPLSEKVRPSSASVFIKHRPDVPMANHVAAIKALVVNSVEGLPYDNVTVTLFPADPWPFAAEKPKDTVGASLVRNAWFFPAMTASGALILLAGMLSMWRRRGAFNEAAAAFKRRLGQPTATEQAPPNSR